MKINRVAQGLWNIVRDRWKRTLPSCSFSVWKHTCLCRQLIQCSSWSTAWAVQSPAPGRDLPVIPSKVPASTAGWLGISLVSQNNTKPYRSQAGKKKLRLRESVGFFYLPISFIDLGGKGSTGENTEPPDRRSWGKAEEKNALLFSAVIFCPLPTPWDEVLEHNCSKDIRNPGSQSNLKCHLA